MDLFDNLIRDSGYSTNLMFTGFCCWAISSLILTKDLGLIGAMLVSATKISLSLMFFGEFYQAKWIGSDDVTYWSDAISLEKLGITPWNYFIGDSWNKVQTYLDSRHVLYEWWNVLGQSLFGKNYYSSVFLNHIPFFLSGFFLCRILAFSKFSSVYRALFLVFFIFHWDTIIWTTALNLKEPFVMSLILASIYLVLRFHLSNRKEMAISFMALILVFLAMSYIRFYMVAILIASIIATQLLNLRFNRTQIVRFALLGLTCLVGALILIPQDKIMLERFDFLGTFKGTVIFLSSPFPWGDGAEQEMLFVTSIFHWLFLIPTFIGFLLLLKNRSELKLIFVFFLIASLFYGSLMAYFGVRQRVQISFVFALAQFHFLWVLLIEPALNRTPPKTLVEYGPCSS